MRKINIILFLLIFSVYAFPQNYWQQQVNYKIDVKLDDENHTLHAFEVMEYINNSPDELAFIYIHLWPNAYKNDSTALAIQLLENGKSEFYYSIEEDRGYIDSLDFVVDGQKVKWEYDSVNIDICKIYLNKPLRSGEKILITTPFFIKIPLGVFSRLGHIGQSYQITQWYPKPAVYDKNGWNQMPYLDMGEFYSEFGSFDVTITLPRNYVVGATGNLQNKEELEWLENKARNNYFYSNNDSFPPSDSLIKTLRYTEENIHDFAWFADKRYNVNKGEVTLPNSGRKVTTWTMYTSFEGFLWRNSIEYVNDAIYYYSLWNGDYPYNNCTAVQGALSAGSGMEYPTITIIGKASNAILLEDVIMHEVGHNWFHGILGFNERKHPWMDEGINTFYDSRYMKTKYPQNKLYSLFGYVKIAKTLDLIDYPQSYQNEIMYLFNAKRNLDQPASLSSKFFTQVNYGGIVYSKIAMAFNYLEVYLGVERFDAIMKKFYNEWKFKHPQPEDLRSLFEKECKENLSWFFDDLINTTKKADYKITSVKKYRNIDTLNITIKNKGQINCPVPISFINNYNTIDTTFWVNGFNHKQNISFPFTKDFYKIKIDANYDIIDINRNNNTLRASGMLKRLEPIRLQFLGSLDNPDKTQLFYCPVIGWNNYNKTMLGMALYNSVAPQKKFEYVFMPFYATNTNDLTGSGEINYFVFPRGLQNIRFSFSASTYNYTTDYKFVKITPSVTFNFKQQNARSHNKQFIRLRHVNISKESYRNEYYYVNQGLYTLTNNRKVNPFNMNLDVQQNESFIRTSVVGNYRFSYHNLKKGFDFRFFAGGFLKKSVEYQPCDARLRISGYSWNINGGDDYLYDYIYLGRNDNTGIFSQQFAETDGGFKVNYSAGLSWDWLTTINMKTSLPGIIPFRLFLDVGTFYDVKNIGSEQIIYDAGVCLPLFKNVLEIYFPIVMSDDLKNNLNSNTENYWQKIRFTLNLNKLNPFEFIRNFEL